ncbi:MAG: type II toxin-antitoxin system VapC family toxin [Acidobacteriaceae bacterium]
MSLVLDSSATVAWLYVEEMTPAIRRVVELLAQNGAWVPSLWSLEVANVLEFGVRRGRHDSTFRDAMLADLSQWRISTDLETSKHAWHGTLQFAHRHRLTLYDAAYLELAHRRRLPLATLDGDLRAAATAEGVPLLGV